MIEAQLEWIRGFVKELTDSTISGIEEWKSFHETGEVPQDWQDLDEQDIALDPERKA